MGSLGVNGGTSLDVPASSTQDTVAMLLNWKTSTLESFLCWRSYERACLQWLRCDKDKCYLTLLSTFCFCSSLQASYSDHSQSVCVLVHQKESVLVHCQKRVCKDFCDFSRVVRWYLSSPSLGSSGEFAQNSFNKIILYVRRGELNRCFQCLDWFFSFHPVLKALNKKSIYVSRNSNKIRIRFALTCKIKLPLGAWMKSIA